MSARRCAFVMVAVAAALAAASCAEPTPKAKPAKAPPPQNPASQRDDSERFQEIAAGLVDVKFCSLAWGDYDADGDPDLAVSGQADAGPMTMIYRNDRGSFTNVSSKLRISGSVAWADYDLDGDLDLAIAALPTSIVLRNEGGRFRNIQAKLIGVSGSLAWGDYDGDGDPDLLIAGYTGTKTPPQMGAVTKLYRNDGPPAKAR